MNIYDNIISTLKSHDINYKLYEHWEILTYEDAEKEKQIHNWEWIESKNVFMKNKAGEYFLFITVQWEKVDFKKMKEITWSKLSLASDEDVRNVIHCVPWCVSPFWFDTWVTCFVDKNIFQHDNYLFSPWLTTKTIQLNPKSLEKIFIEKWYTFLKD